MPGIENTEVERLIMRRRCKRIMSVMINIDHDSEKIEAPSSSKDDEEKPDASIEKNLIELSSLYAQNENCICLKEHEPKWPTFYEVNCPRLSERLASNEVFRSKTPGSELKEELNLMDNSVKFTLSELIEVYDKTSKAAHLNEVLSISITTFEVRSLEAQRLVTRNPFLMRDRSARKVES